MERAQQGDRLLRGAGSLLYLVPADRGDPPVARSLRVCLGGLAYFIAVMGAWIAYAEAVGI